MAEYKKAWGVFDARKYEEGEPFKLSRSKIDLFIQCPRCFYLDRRLGVGRPSMPPFTLNNAVDALLKKEFDISRAEQTAHPIMDEYGIDAVPFAHKDINEWRENFKGIQHVDKTTNLKITGAVDDVWVNPKGELIIVDYKATSKDAEITLDDEWKDGYKRQMEVYQWLLREKGFKVSETGYFLFANGQQNRETFDSALEFELTLLPYKGDTEWIPKTLKEIARCLTDDRLPGAKDNCEHCNYRQAAGEAIKEVVLKSKKTKSKDEKGE
jgi:CRISPR/Cas system-associated exonuclease Cas4 (RecB family)